MSGKYTTLSPVNSRFAYETGDASPLITNFTTDYPVLPNSGGDWSLRPILKIPGKTLLGKRVISTRPSDTFVFGENIKVPTKNILIFDKNTSQELYEAFLKALNNAEGVRKGRFVLDKPRDYGLEFEQALLKAATDGWRPRLKDYLFMDYVLRPKYLSLVYNADILSSKNLPDDILNAMSNALSRSLLFDGHYKNVVYDPSSPVESEFRKNKGIILRSKIPINKRNFNFGKDVRVKQCKKNNIVWV